MSMPKGGFKSGHLPELVLDVLLTDGGWLTSRAVMLRLETHKPESVKRALSRLRVRGLVADRVRELNGHGHNSPKEWRAL